MTDTLLCIGGPFDGRRHESLIEDSQTLILFDNQNVRIGVGPKAIPEKSTVTRSIYTRQSIHFGGSASVDFWVHESLSIQQAVMKLMGCYTGDAE